MNVCITNAQHTDPVNTARIRRLVRDAARQLAIRTRGRLDITFLDARRMQGINKQFLRQNRSTDVLSFRYDAAPLAPGNGRPIVGEIFIAPSQAQAYAKRHGLSYAEELSRYVVHGLLHWLGEEDRTPAQQRRMRRLENDIILKNSAAGGRAWPGAGRVEGRAATVSRAARGTSEPRNRAPARHGRTRQAFRRNGRP